MSEWEFTRRYRREVNPEAQWDANFTRITLIRPVGTGHAYATMLMSNEILHAAHVERDRSARLLLAGEYRMMRQRVEMFRRNWRRLESLPPNARARAMRRL